MQVGKHRLLFVFGLLPCLLLTLHSLCVLPLFWKTTSLENIRPVQGHAFVSSAPREALLYPVNTAARVLENEKPLPFPPQPSTVTVAEVGLGRYMVGRGKVVFSSTDNSDPRFNRRVYQIVQPWPVPRLIIIFSWILSILSLSWIIFKSWAVLRPFLFHPPFWALGVLFGLLLVANRCWLFKDYPLVAVHPDSGSYFAITELIKAGEWPNLGNRPPGYPLFMKAVFAFSNTLIALSLVQTIFTALTALSLVYGIYKWRPYLGFPAVAVMAAYVFGCTTLEHDTAMLSESLYASLLMLSFGAILIGFRKSSSAWMGTASFSMALAILTRPAGLFLIITFIFCVVWFFRKGIKRTALLAFLLPFPLLLGAMSLYNYKIVKALTPTTWGEANLAVATFTYWEQDRNYPTEINKSIEKIQQIISERLKVTKKDRAVLARSWKPRELGQIYVEGFNGPALDIAMLMGGDYETSARKWIRRIAFDSIKKNPTYYAKFVFTMLYQYFTPVPDEDFRTYLKNRAYVFYVNHHFSSSRGLPQMTRMAKEQADSSPRPPIVVTDFNENTEVQLQDRILIPSTWWFRIYEFTHHARKHIFSWWIWPFSIFAGCLISICKLARSRLGDDEAFMLFIITLSAVGASLVVSLVEFAQPRYSCPMEWAYGIALILTIAIVFDKKAPPQISSS